MVKYDETFYNHQTTLKTQAIMESNMFCKKRSFESRSTSINLNRYHSLGIFSRRQIDNILSYLSQKIGFNISCKLSSEAICMKCQNLFSGKNKIFFFFNLHLLTILPTALSVTQPAFYINLERAVIGPSATLTGR